MCDEKNERKAFSPSDKGMGIVGTRAASEDLGGRVSARSAIEDRARRLRREATMLEALSRALPVELSAAADEALWQLVIRTSRSGG
jgi:hypothetical protein